MMKDPKSLTIEELREVLATLGEKPYRADQIFGWMHQRLVTSWDEMTNLPKSLREKLKDSPITALKLLDLQVSALDGTRKYLFGLSDGNCIESVMMPYHHGNTVCISSQVGCNMGCRFCASTIGGKIRDLSPSEMLDQIYRIQADTGERVHNVVVMGSGEPLDNYAHLLSFIRLLICEQGLHISQRNITISTCGLVPEILMLSQERLGVTLAISLHAPTDELRKTLMPVANRYSICQILDACRAYFQTTGRRVSFEYSLISQVNDTKLHAAALGQLLAPLRPHVNLIPVNPVRERSFVRTQPRQVADFKNELEKYQINVTIRREMGADIDGACGQLRARHMAQALVPAGK